MRIRHIKKNQGAEKEGWTSKWILQIETERVAKEKTQTGSQK